MQKELKGWLLDAYPSSNGMTLWFITEEQQRVRLMDSFHPSFYFDGPTRELQNAFLLLSEEKTPLIAKQVERIEFFSGQPIPVVQVIVDQPSGFPHVVKRITRTLNALRFYNCDINLTQLYFYERDLFPLVFCFVVFNENNQVLSIQALNSSWDLDYSIPPLRNLHLKLEGELLNPNHGWRGKLEMIAEQEGYLLEAEDPEELLGLFNSHLLKHDPDIVFTDWGDSFLFPQLQQMADEARIPLALNRDAERRMAGKRSRSYASYGRIVYNAGAQTLFGRCHIDRQNSFILHEAGMEGLFEQARVTKLPLQHLARTSTGTGITSMQLEVAYRRGILIPWRKREPEAFKSAEQLLTIDKGGLVFLPPVGFYEEVAELDFASMYPAIMAKFNVSPETVGCSCCPENRVPETGYSICTRRKGLVPQTLEPLLAKRSHYKKRLQSATDPVQKKRYDQRQTALKWLLVVSFGYLGYKNARFGRIEAHECVTAYSREMLLRAKEIAEAQGFRLLHAIVDSLWLKKPGAAEQDYENLAKAISHGTELPINFEGIYRWIGFLPSKTKPTLSVPNRFYGVFRDGKVKVRGLEVRRSDTPAIIKEAQTYMMDLLNRTETLKDYEACIPHVLEILRDYRQRIHEGQVALCDLVISRDLSKDPRQYQKATLSAVAAQELLARGIKLDPGESIQYIITNAEDKDPTSRARAYPLLTSNHSYDREKYMELLLKAGESLLSLFGYDLKKLDALTG
ncbi:MAG TPA: DNA polymerase domain-containing protein [Nitrospiria bacterium]